MASATEAAVSGKRYPDEEFARRGPEIYQRVVAPRLTPADDGKYVILDIETEEYEVDASKLAAALRLRARVPGAQGWLVRVGRAAPTRMRSPRRPA
jgi:hypothetical protein